MKETDQLDYPTPQTLVIFEGILPLPPGNPGNWDLRPLT
jgi:hypothetical protein